MQCLQYMSTVSYAIVLKAYIVFSVVFNLMYSQSLSTFINKQNLSSISVQ